MASKHEIHPLENGLRHYPSRTVQVFNTTHLSRILRKHAHETEADRYRKEFSSEQWIKSLFFLPIQKFPQVRPFVRQLEQNRLWQLSCGLDGNVPTQGQYSRRLSDPKLQEILFRTFQTYQKLIPKTRHRYPFTPLPVQLEILTHRYRPFYMDCTSFQLSPNRYCYASPGWVASEKLALPSARLHLIMESFHGIIVNYGPSEGNAHESPVADQLLSETEDLLPWLKDSPLGDQLRPFLVFDRGYWKQTRFIELDRRGWGWCIPWKKRTFIGAQLEVLTFPVPPDEPLELLVWKKNYTRPWRRIIGKSNPSDPKNWDVLTGDLGLVPSTVLTLQKDRWHIEVMFAWLKQRTTLKQPLGKSYLG